MGDTFKNKSCNVLSKWGLLENILVATLQLRKNNAIHHPFHNKINPK